jgi:hypothetical protein
MRMVKCGCDGYLGNKSAANYQDKAYGAGMRVASPTSTPKKFRCTICQREHTFGDEKEGKK